MSLIFRPWPCRLSTILWRPILLACFLVGLSHLVADRAQAYDRSWTLALRGGYSLQPQIQREHGVGFGADLARGLSDEFELRLSGEYWFHPTDTHRLRSELALVYVVDVFQVIPYLGVATGVLASFDSDSVMNQSQADWIVSGVVGVDYMLSRETFIGVEVRPALLPTRMDQKDFFVLSATARVGWIFSD